MSYVIHLFEHPGPATLADALALHERLSATRARPGEALQRWCRRMQARFPDGYEDWDEDAPEDSTGGSPVLSVGLYTHAMQQLLPAAVSLALPLGLCVLDEQAGRCYLPGGWALTHRGRFALQPVKADTPLPGTPVRIEPGSLEWTQQKLIRRMGPALAPHGFKAMLRAAGLRFARIVPMGFQALNLTVREGPRVEPAVTLEPVLPHALVKVVRPGNSLSCHTLNFAPLERFGAKADPNPANNPWYRLATNPHEIDALADALVQWLLENFLPLFDACQDLPGILRCDSLRNEPGQRAFIGRTRVTLALKHWVQGGDLASAAQQLADALFGENHLHREIVLRRARALRAMPEWEAAWRPLRAPCRHYELHEALTAPELADAAFARLRRVAESHGFAVIEELPLSVRLRRQSAEVVQTLELLAEPRALSGVKLNVSVRWEAPALTAHWRSSWPGAAGVDDVAQWQSRTPSYFWMPGPLQAAGIDDHDFTAQLHWPDQLEDHVGAAEVSLRRWCERLLDPALTWQGLAQQLPTVEELTTWGSQVWMGTFLARLELDGYITLLMLSGLYRTDAAAYAAAMRAGRRDVSEIEPLLLLVERVAASK